MSAAVDLVALSLLPIWRWRAVAEQLRTGETPAAILHAQCRSGFRGGGGPRRGPIRRGRRHAPARQPNAGSPPVCEPLALTPTAIQPACGRLRTRLRCCGSRGQPDALARSDCGYRRVARGFAVCPRRRRTPGCRPRRAWHHVVERPGARRRLRSAPGALVSRRLTVGVLGCGADVVYPPEHATLAAEIAARGAVVERTRARDAAAGRVFFPQRNRIISGLARAVVVIEAGEKSGSLITARCALEQGRDVLAVPGNVLSGRNRGGHALLQRRGTVVETADDILEELGLVVGRSGIGVERRPRPAPDATRSWRACCRAKPIDLDADFAAIRAFRRRVAASAARARTGGRRQAGVGGRTFRAGVDRTC